MKEWQLREQTVRKGGGSQQARFHDKECRVCNETSRREQEQEGGEEE